MPQVALDYLARDFEAWRKHYDELSFEDHKRVYGYIAEAWPEQRFANVEEALAFFDEFQPRTVIELGGWDGHLASVILPRHTRILSWRNYELVRVPQMCKRKAYDLRVLDQPLWEYRSLRADAFVATHVIEHIRAWELERLLSKLTVEACLIEAPLAPHPTDWSGQEATHILELGWEGVDALFENRGFMVGSWWQYGRFYVR